MSESSETYVLTLKDFQNVVNLIDVFSTRGAVAGEEMIGVGLLREKFARFIENSKKDSDEDDKEEQSE